MTPLLTIFGRAKINAYGYYKITSRKEGNHGKLLHRLIFEKFHGPIPENYVVHHKDGDKLNNCILNLELLTSEKHQQNHHLGNEKIHRKISLAHNNTGYRNVSINRRDQYKQGFTYRYRYYDEGKHKAIYCVSLEGLKEKVLAKGLPWEKYSEEATA